MAKANRFISDDKAQMGNVGIQAVMALIVIGVMIYVGLQIMEGVTDSTQLVDDTVATTIFTQSGVSVHGQIITIGSETYTVTNTTSVAFDVPVGDVMDNSTLIAALVAEITASSTLVTSVDNADDTTTITSVLVGTVGNYVSTENMTNGAFTGVAMSGGTDGDTFYDTQVTVTDGVNSSFGLTGVLMLVIIAAAIIAILMMFAVGRRQ